MIEKYLFELLKSDAVRANDNLENKKITEASYAQIANITWAFESARQRIIESAEYISIDDREEVKRYFRGQFRDEIVQAMYNSTPPEVVWGIMDPSYDEQEVVNRWQDNRDFFWFSIDLDTVFNHL